MTNIEYIEKYFLLGNKLRRNTYNSKDHAAFFHLLTAKHLTDNKAELIWLEMNGGKRTVCQECNGDVKFLSYDKGYRAYCSAECMRRSSEVKLKRKTSFQATCLEIYGVDNPMKTESVQQRVVNTNRNRRGVDYFCQSSDFRDKYAETCVSKYGISHAMTPTTVQKVQETLLSRHNRTTGPDFTKNRVDRHQIITDWCSDMSITGSDPALSELQYMHTFMHSECGQTWQQNLFKLPRCPVCHRGSLVETNFKIWADKLGVPVKFNDRSVIAPLELDVVFPESKIAIEINGVYWHSDQMQKISVKEKTDLCASVGIQLISIWEYEWNDQSTKEKIKKIILAKLGLSPRVFARKLHCEVISLEEARKFQNQYHLQSWCAAGLYYGLKDADGVLKMCMSFGKRRFSTDTQQIELIRMCTDGSTVVGGISKLLAFATKFSNADIFTYCDRRFGNGAGYVAVGFEHLGSAKPNYKWFKGSVVLNRGACQRRALPTLLDHFDPAETEAVNMESNGWLRISDAGNHRFILRR